MNTEVLTMADFKIMLQNLRNKSKCCKKDDFTGERYTIIYDISIETLNMICEDGIEQLENAQTVNRWIPCSERLPELDTMVIVCYYGSDLIMPMHGETVTEAIARQNKVPTVTMGFLDEYGWNGADMFPMIVQPTFWMNLPDAPLPEPPESSI